MEVYSATQWDQWIEQQQWDALRERLRTMHVSDIAEMLTLLPHHHEAVVFRLLPRDKAAQVFAYLPVDRQEQLLHSLSSEAVKDILDQMAPDDRTRLLEEFPAEVTRRLLDALSPEELRSARQLLGYPERSVGRYMTPRYVAIKPEMTAAQALEYVRKVGRGMETLNVVYIVDDQGKLVEDLRLGSLVLADPNDVVSTIADPALVALVATDDRSRALELFEKYDRVALPVTDAEGNMLGIVTADDVLDVAQSEATEDIQKLGGSEALDAPYPQVGMWAMIRKRGVWLSALFLGEMLTATAMSFFEKEIARAVVLALFVPLIISS